LKTFITFRIGMFAFYVPVSGAQMLLIMVAITALLGAFFWHEIQFERAHPTHYHSLLGTP
jgi:hypothetical protein